MSDDTRQRAGVGEHTAAARRVLLTPSAPGALAPGLRITAAARAAELTGQPGLAARYRAWAPQGAADGDPSLTAAVRDFTDRVTLAPGAAGPGLLRALTARGLDAPAVVALAQICAFVAYEARVVSGLALLSGEPATEPVEPSPAPSPVEPRLPSEARFTLDELSWRPRIPAVDADALTAGQRAVIDAHATLSVASPYYRTLLHDPAALDHRTHVYNAVMYGRGGLPRAERELATLLVSRANGCVYCASVHGRKYAQLSRDEAAALRVLSEGGAALADDARGRAIARFAEAQTSTPPRAGADDVAALRAAGLTEAELTDLVHAVALFGWANRLMLVLGDAQPVRRPDAGVPHDPVPHDPISRDDTPRNDARDDARESCSGTPDRNPRTGDA
ncbi:peroxidase-related enzyme [Streptomyces scopuliridis]|uniref:Peroxidase-related enzyme n=1 Tax=Streptomyces scopuliridis TaxID=452529 RepID=A0ACD4ZUH6_9ACTN|nr:peroxidase-related enzyme [Streptomyces scopuliridis]WSB37657.1 peroxidase-related enzyme [Streptomyces scopuliridis]WSC02111.1 peroxidase-related enzyme [Streptomyces scopuliridis]WSC04352.1 peroxidase-related enzyme [Streptomyces scopuliridis]